MKGLCVVITTARHEEELRYPAWGKLAREALAGRRKDPHLSDEWLSLCASLQLFPAVQHHVIHQLRALQLQTRLPNAVIVVDRTLGTGKHTAEALENALDEEDLDFPVTWTQPQVGLAEMAAHPQLALQDTVLSSDASSGMLPERTRKVPYGNADKNTGLVLCQHEWVLMLDDGTLPSFALCEKAAQACEQDKVLLIGHRKLYQPTEARDHIEVVDDLAFGVWALPIKHVLAVNGFNTRLDGKRGPWDLELRHRMNLYAQNAGLKFEQDSAARCYEIEHDYPWADAPAEDDWKTAAGDSWRASGPSLKKMRQAAILDLQRGHYATQPTDEEDAQEEVFDEED